MNVPAGIDNRAGGTEDIYGEYCMQAADVALRVDTEVQRSGRLMSPLPALAGHGGRGSPEFRSSVSSSAIRASATFRAADSACRAAASRSTRLSAASRAARSSAWPRSTLPVSGSYKAYRTVPVHSHIEPRHRTAQLSHTEPRRHRRQVPVFASAQPHPPYPRRQMLPRRVVQPVLLHTQPRIPLRLLVPVHPPGASRHHLQHEVRALRLLPHLVAQSRGLLPLRRSHHHVHVRRHHRPRFLSS